MKRPTAPSNDRARRRRLRFRPQLQILESRRVLAQADDLSAITGILFDDINGNSVAEPGEPRIVGAEVRLENGSGSPILGTNNQPLSATTNSSGVYTFPRLQQGSYVVRQISQTIPGGRQLSDMTSPVIVISATDVQGTLVEPIDTFDTTGQTVLDSVADGVPVTSSQATTDAIGGHRDLIVNKTSTNGSIQLSVNEAAADVITFDSITGGDGERRIVWDGNADGNPLTVADTGGFVSDLTGGGNSLGFILDMGTDIAGSTALLRVYSNDSNAGTSNRFSTATVDIPIVNSALDTVMEFVPFSAFTANGGGADFTNATAVELVIQGMNQTNGSAKLIGAFAATQFTANFDNFEQADLSITKSANVQSPNVGDTVTYTLAVTNLGPQTATSVQVTDQLPAGVTFLSSSNNAAYNTATGIWNIGSLPVGAANRADLTITGRVDSLGGKTNTASITRSDQTDPITSNNSASATLTPRQIDLSVNKTASTTSPNIGQRVTFFVDVSNAGPDAATGVSVRDLLPSGLRIENAGDITTTQGTYTPGTGIWTVGTVGINETERLTITAVVDTVGSRTNSAEVIAAGESDFDSTPGDGTGDDFASVDLTTPSANLSLTKTVSNPLPNVGDDVNFTITVSNAGPDAATGVTVLDQLPIGMTFQNASVGGGYNAATGVWTIGSIAAGGEATLTLAATVDTVGTKTNTAQVQTVDQNDPNSSPGNNAPVEDDQASVSLTPQAANLSLAKSVTNLSPEVGDTITFQITVSNSGPNNATGVQVRDRLPAGTQFVSATYGAGTNRPGNPDYNQTTGVWNVGDVTVGAPVTLNLNVLVTAPGLTTNSAEIIASDQSDPNSTPGNGNPAEDDQDNASIQPRQIDLSLTKTVNDFSPSVGDEIEFVITVNNAGPDVATSVLVAEQLPQGVTVLSNTPTRGSYNVSTGVWNIGTIGLNDPVSLSIRTRVDSIGSGTNVAQVSSADQSDSDSIPGNSVATEDDQASVSFTTQVADLSLTKTVVDTDRPNVGDTVSFDIEVTNAGPDDATGVQVTDLLPSGIRFTSNTLSEGIYNASSGVWTIGNIPAPTEKQVLVIGSQIYSATSGTLLFTQQNSPATYQSQLASFRTDPLGETRNALIALGYVPSQFQLREVARSDNANGINVEIRFLNAALEHVDVPNVNVTGNLDIAVSSTTEETSSVNTNSTVMLRINGVLETTNDLSNTAQITASDQSDPDSQPANSVATEDDQDSAALMPQQIDLSLTKTASTNKPNPGDEVTFLLSVTNSGLDPATGVQVTDQLPAGLTFVRSLPANVYDPVTGIWNVGGVGLNTTNRLEIVARADTEVTLTNSAEITAADQSDIDSIPGNNLPTEDDQAFAEITPATSDLSLTKTVDDNTPNVGNNVVFTITVNNSGPDPATNVNVRDQLPAGMTFVSDAPTLGSFDENSGIWTIPALAINQDAVLRITASVDSVDDKTNVAQITASDQFDPDSTPANDVPDEDDQASAALSPELVDLALTKSINDDNPNIGDVVEFEIGLTNQGPSTATGVTVLDLLPDGLTFRGTRGSVGGYDPRSGIWNVGSVAPGATPSIIIEAIVEMISSAENTAEIRSVDQPDLDSTPGNAVAGEDDQASVTLTTQIADLSLTKTVDNANPGRTDEIEFLITVSNAGPNTATGVVVADQLPSGLRLVAANPSSGQYDPETGNWTIGQISVGAPETLRLTAAVTSAQSATNAAEIVMSRQIDPNSTPGNGNAAEDDQATAAVTPRVVDVSVLGTIDNLEPMEGDVVQVVFTAANEGPADATGVVFNVTIPDTLTLMSSQPQDGSFDSVSGLWTLGDLAAGSASRLVLNLRVDARGIRQVPIELVATNEFDRDSTPDNGVATEDDLASVVVQAPRLINKRLFLAR
ncbi:SdrD B-like domain-containing protein [Stieleria varia]|uniref:Translocon-associated protein beta (TRAPB) n=1 Tax=Stieleria varia TaxID=2528005 RepID=A0A5C6B3N5_9BACT|nr:SdrD B-like domain-containing protein [Stieleria varia]TWU05979.1 Translocon-associated protein beta (TRAPB) [Stieleria varia]